MIQGDTILANGDTNSQTIQSLLTDISKHHLWGFGFLIVLLLVSVIAIIALYIAYRWGKKAQSHLQTEKIKYKKSFYFSQTILNAIPDELYRINKDGDIIPTLELPEEVEKQTKEFTYIGKNIYQVWHYDFARKVAETIKEVISSKTSTSFEFSYLHHGVIKWYNIQMAPFGDWEVLTSLRDITEHYLTKSKQEESEFLFQTQFEHGLNGIAFLNDKLEILNVNNRLGEILGYTTSEMLTLKWSDIIEPENLDYDLYMFAKTNQLTGINLETEKKFLNKAGEIVHIYCTIISYYNALLKRKTYIVTFQDISFRKEHERTILNAIIKTEEKERTNFAQEIHDGVGPILSSIKMYIQWLQRTDSKTDKEQILKDCETLIDDAHVAVREVSFNLSPHVLKNFGLIASLQSFTDRLKEATKVNIIFEIDDPKQRFPESVEVVLYRGVTECINNTIKYAKANNIAIRIKNTARSIELFYTDDGIGFDANEVLGSAKGTGLYNIQSRVKSINGECHFLGGKGSGTKILFVIKL